MRFPSCASFSIPLPRSLRCFLLGLSVLPTLALPGAFAQQAGHTFLRVKLAEAGAGGSATPLSGRLLVFLKRGSGDKEVSTDEFHPTDAYVAAMEVDHLTPGSSVELDADTIAFPAPFSTLPPGTYEVQAVLDPGHTYNYSGRTPEDWISEVAVLKGQPGSGEVATLTLDRHPAVEPARARAMAAAHAGVQPGQIEEQRFVSPALTKFWGKPSEIRAWVVLPPGYAEHPGDRYPTVYWTSGFGGTHATNLLTGLRLRDRMVAGTMPPMIWVMLDESCPEGTHEFADSVNNGPWGTALTSEFIPALEARYRMDARPSGRFLNGHSSGGWATLQLQINYPETFGGTWSTSPDSSDFHNFTGPDLYAAHANVYRRPDGSAYPIMRIDGKVIATIEQFNQLEQVVGPYGGQFSSFDWVFSPRSQSGAPMRMFDTVSGDVNPEVVAYWHEHYDLAYRAEVQWPREAAHLKGRIHLYVGTADTFYLDGAAHLLEARLRALGAEPHFQYLAGRSHFDMYVVGSDRSGLFDVISAEMYAVARPGVAWHAKS